MTAEATLEAAVDSVNDEIGYFGVRGGMTESEIIYFRAKVRAELPDKAWDHHLAGYHDLCRPRRSRNQGFTPSHCEFAGHVERLHSHSFEGCTQLCGCVDWKFVGVSQ